MRFALVVLAFAALGMVGCSYHTAVRAQAGKAFVVKSGLFGSSFWNCEASGGKPKCYKVIKQ